MVNLIISVLPKVGSKYKILHNINYPLIKRNLENAVKSAYHEISALFSYQDVSYQSYIKSTEAYVEIQS